jgi:hypothetical protein
MLELVAAVPDAGVNVKVPDPMVPVNFKPKLVKFATPLEKLANWLITLFTPLPNPLTVPIKLVVTVMLLPEASNPVTVFPYASCAVKVFVPVKAVPFVCGLVKLTANLVIVDALTATVKRSAPAAEILPSVTATTADSTLYNFMLVVTAPEAKVKAVVDPNAISAAAVLVTLGVVTGAVELVAPEKVKFLEPV